MGRVAERVVETRQPVWLLSTFKFCAIQRLETVTEVSSVSPGTPKIMRPEPFKNNSSLLRKHLSQTLFIFVSKIMLPKDYRTPVKIANALGRDSKDLALVCTLKQ